jgi:hypothetical protein
MIATGCGNGLYAMRVGRVSSELELAERGGALVSAPYEYYFADEHLRKARAEAAESDFGDALDLLGVAEQYARLARDGNAAPPNVAAAPATSSRKVPSEVARLEQVAIEAELSGARRCAPRELAIGRSQLTFAAIEDAQGGAAQASDHLRLAELNVQAARLLATPEHCRASHAKTSSR